MKLSTDLPFLEDGKAFVKPEVVPVLTSDLITSPGVGDLVSGDVYLRFVRGDDGW